MELKSEKTKEAFNAWLKTFDGIQIHPLDDERFYQFVKQFYLQDESVTREAFSKEAKRYTYTSRSYKRGICQKYYDKMMVIIDFIKKMHIQLWDDLSFY